jgi:MOSC domain-containing protein YiiM
VLRTLTAHNRIAVVGLGDMPCAGVYAMVVSPGTLRAGDPIRLS